MTPPALPSTAPADIAEAVERRRKAEVCPMQEWLTEYGYTQAWLAKQLEPRQDSARGAGRERPISPNLIYLWFTRRTIKGKRYRPSAERISEMSRITGGKVTVGELRAYFEKEGVVRRRMTTRRRP